MVRAIFIPDRGHHHWRKYDYSSIESRILAHFAVGQGSKDLRKEYKNNPDTDYHNFTQAMIKRLVGLELPRKHVKNVNFAGIYGASEKKLQSMMGLTNEEAEEFFEAYHSGLPYVRATMKHMSDYAETHGYTRTIMGRRALFDKWEPKYYDKNKTRPFPLKFEEAVAAYGPNIKRSHLHKGLNYTIQGSAADLMKAAIVKCHKDGVFDQTTLPRMIIHDELTFSVPDNKRNEAFKEMRHIMETAITFKIPVRVQGEMGANWSDTKIIVD
jgi:DNA polymerase-1